MFIFCVDKNLKPQNPVHPAVARVLLRERKACVHKRFPFSIRLGVSSGKDTHALQLKIDPGSIKTGLALVNHSSGAVLWGAELEHHGKLIKKKLETRRVIRRARRSRKTRYRAARFLNRMRPKGWLPPSLESRISNVLTWVNRLRTLVPVGGISYENCSFDTQRMVEPEISGVAYQQGELAGYEIRQYLLEKFNRTCVYCGAKNVPLQVEHIIPKAVGGSNKVSNLTIACGACNRVKGAQPIEEFLKAKPALLKKIKAQLKAPLRDAAAMNAVRWELWRRLVATGLPMECGSGGLTKFNRSKQGLPKAHWLDAACVGKSTPVLKNTELAPLLIKAFGRGLRQMCYTNKYGFPKRYRQRSKRKGGFQTGDVVKAIMPSGVVYSGRLTTRARPSYKIGTADGINPKYIRLLQRCGGYACTV